jgi:hypothetical protein
MSKMNRPQVVKNRWCMVLRCGRSTATRRNAGIHESPSHPVLLRKSVTPVFASGLDRLDAEETFLLCCIFVWEFSDDFQSAG